MSVLYFVSGCFDTGIDCRQLDACHAVYSPIVTPVTTSHFLPDMVVRDRVCIISANFGQNVEPTYLLLLRERLFQDLGHLTVCFPSILSVSFRREYNDSIGLYSATVRASAPTTYNEVRRIHVVLLDQSFVHLHGLNVSCETPDLACLFASSRDRIIAKSAFEARFG